MIAIRTYKLNLVPGTTSNTVVHVSQYDNTTISIKFEIYNGVETFAKPPGASACVQITKRDKKAIDANCTYNDDGTIEFALSEQMTAVSGSQRGKIVILDSAGGQIGTAAFLLDVDAAGISDNAVISDSDISDLQKALDKAGDINANTAAAAESAKSASASAGAAAKSAGDATASATAAANSATNASGYADSALASATQAAGYAGEAEYRLMINPETGHMALAHFTKEA